MAKMFYTLEETQEALAKNEEEVRQLAREGRLREFRDGQRLMFKADQVEQIKSEMGIPVEGAGVVDRVDLGPSDSGSPLSLSDSEAPSGTGISLMDSDQAGDAVDLKEDTATPAEVASPGSDSGIPDEFAAAGDERSASGISVFGIDESEAADPSAQTAMPTPAMQDQLNLEGVGSGSGLLDLTRESDDTSLGADVWDEVEGGESGARETGSVVSESMQSMALPRGGVTRPVGPTYVEAADPMAPAFGAASLAAFVVLIFGGLVLAASVLGTWPAFVGDVAQRGMWMIWGIGVVAAVVLFVVGLLIGKSGGR